MFLGVLSNERLNPWINWTTLGPPFLQPLADMRDSIIIAPPPLLFANFGDWLRVRHLTRSVDTVFWMQESARPELPVHIASLMCGKVRRTALVIDAWRPLLNKIGILASAQRLAPCFVAFREACEELRRRFPRTSFVWLPFGVDTNVFDTADETRPIFAFWMGRRYEPLHQAMVRYCSERGLIYRYRQPGVFPSPVELGKLVGSSRYFLVTPPDLDNPHRTGGFSPLVMRYLEGLAAGSRLLGVLPRSGEYEALLPLNAILQVRQDGSDLAEKLDADRMNPDVHSAVQQARKLVRQQHSWAIRAQQVHDYLSTGKPIGFD